MEVLIEIREGGLVGAGKRIGLVGEDDGGFREGAFREVDEEGIVSLFELGGSG